MRRRERLRIYHACAALASVLLLPFIVAMAWLFYAFAPGFSCVLWFAAAAMVITGWVQLKEAMRLSDLIERDRSHRYKFNS